jgi:GNAT superfamily N-acetyltransferase
LSGNTFYKKGIGKKLISYVKNDLKEKGYTSLVIWTLEENLNKKFYEKLGGKEFSNRQIDILGQKLKEIGYLYENK